jgi:hypothetical protein
MRRRAAGERGGGEQPTISSSVRKQKPSSTPNKHRASPSAIVVPAMLPRTWFSSLLYPTPSFIIWKGGHFSTIAQMSESLSNSNGCDMKNVKTSAGSSAATMPSNGQWTTTSLLLSPPKTWLQFGYHIARLEYGRFLAWLMYGLLAFRNDAMVQSNKQQ